MAGQDIIMASQRELKRLHIIQKILEDGITQRDASDVLTLSDRQIRRLVKRVKIEGEKGVIHRSRGRASNRRIPQKLKEKVLKLYRKHYQGFGPLLQRSLEKETA